jgi:hypothetical protein
MYWHFYSIACISIALYPCRSYNLLSRKDPKDSTVGINRGRSVSTG